MAHSDSRFHLVDVVPHHGSVDITRRWLRIDWIVPLQDLRLSITVIAVGCHSAC
jgi:hypothetical protein